MSTKLRPALVLSADLDQILRGVSRSFYLTLRVLPRAVRGPIGLAYLFCRAADTIADTRLLPRAERLELLLAFRAGFGDEGPGGGGQALAARIAGQLDTPLRVPAERELLERLDACFASLESAEDRERVLIERLVTTLTRGMEIDLTRFPAEESGETAALEDDAALDTYCYHVAGCVGEFWTDVCAHRLRALEHWDLPTLRERGVRFGKGLQLTNILRDVDGDLEIGRSYLPSSRLVPLGLDARSLRAADDRRAVRPVIADLLERTLEHYAEGEAYTLSIPRRLVSLRLACAWPLLIGYDTLALLARAEDPCGRGVVLKVTRPEVRRTLRRSLLRCVSNGRLGALLKERRARVEDALLATRG